MGKLSCNVVRDLLPNYIEGLTREETNIEINEHLSGCEKCTEIKNMMEEKDKEGESKENKRESLLFKRIKRRITKRIICVLIICIGVIVAYICLTQVPVKRLSAKDVKISADSFAVNSDSCQLIDTRDEEGNFNFIGVRFKDYNYSEAYFGEVEDRDKWIEETSVFALSIYSDYHIRYYNDRLINQSGEKILYIEDMRTTLINNKSKVLSPMLSFMFYSDEFNSEYKDIDKVVFVNPDGSESVVYVAEK